MQVSKILLLSSLLLNRDETSKCLDAIFKQPVVVLRGVPKNLQNFDAWKPETYLILAPNATVLEQMLEKWSTIESFNPRAKFWLLTHWHEIKPKTLTILAKFYIVNVAIVTRTGQVFTYYPYKYENIAQPDTKPVLLGQCDNVPSFPDKLPKFWRNTTVQVLTKCLLPYVDCSDLDQGLETQIFDLVQEFLKFKVRRIFDKSFKFGLAKINGSYSASFRFLQEREVDMAMGSFRSVGSTQFRDFEFSTNHMEDKLVWVVPKARPMVHWVRLVKIFEPSFWGLLVVLTVAMARVFEKMARFTDEPMGIYRKSGFRVAVLILIGSYLKKTPKRFEMRIIFIFWIYFCMVLNIVFNSNLTNVFFGTFNTFQVNSFDDIIKSNLEMGLTDDVMHILSQEQNWPEITSTKVISSCAFGPACLNRTIFQRNLVCCWGERSIKFRMAKFYTTQVHYVDDHLLFFYLLFYFVKGYPIVPQISKMIVQLKSAGFVQFIKSKVDKLEPRQGNELTTKILTLKRLEGPFYFLLVGWVGGIMIFGYEVVTYERKRRKKVRQEVTKILKKKKMRQNEKVKILEI
ncbi:hypothetical protein TcasGA2_TC007830 [Tribolium castaneum]|uniref:Ionotropic glutamate receptor C-terminal domain-containing protein n=1 Tax=Tribolium castaneum TaxID=7070 RepID=D2A2D1_TRICA|nr:hypothetical protein TcasGA2_TC007830 [Tribolium castaneum]